MKKLITTIAVVLVTALVSFAQDTVAKHDDYKRFRTGTFEYMGLYKGIIVTRTKGKQVEYDPATKGKLVFKVKWPADDTYQIIFVKSVNQSPGPFKKGDVLTTKITSATQDTYAYHWEFNNKGGDGHFKKLK